MNKSQMQEIYNHVVKSGFPFELKVASKFEAAGWRTSQNNYYIDLDENKSRELDLTASLLKQDDESVYTEMNFRLIVEIKNTIEHPWVFFTSNSSRQNEHLDSLG